MTDANGKPELIFRSGYTCAICGQYVPTSVENHIHYSPKVLELQAENDDLKKTQAELISSLNAEGGRYAQLRLELAEARQVITNLLEKMNMTYNNTEYVTAFTLYATHMGDYKKNGGIQWTDEQDAATAFLAKYPEPK